MGTGAVSGHSSSSSSNQVFSTPASSVATDNHSRPALNRSVQRGAPPSQSSSSQAGSSIVRNSMPNKVLSCETCDNSFTFFKRKKTCKDCHRSFCSTCLPKPPSSQRQNGRQCGKCTILTSGKFTRQQLLAWRVKDMRCFLDVRNIPTATCKEKHDLIDLLLLHFCLESNSVLHEQQEHDRRVGELADRMRNSSFYTSPSLPHQVHESPRTSGLDNDNNQSQDQRTTSEDHQEMDSEPQEPATEARDSSPSTAGSQESRHADTNNDDVFMTEQLRQRQYREMREAMQRLQEELDQGEPETRQSNQRASIDDLESADDADKLTVKQLKEILVNNFVDYRGCCEKHELVDRVKRLWNETHANRQRVAEAEEPPATKDSTEPASTSGQKGRDPEQDLCKICMDAPTDCILLECGHMVTCTKCGKRLADCPICRQYITRVVHVFRS